MIIDAHHAFARDLAALARQHGIGDLDMTFSLSPRWVSCADPPPPPAYQRVRLIWSDRAPSGLTHLHLVSRTSRQNAAIPEEPLAADSAGA